MMALYIKKEGIFTSLQGPGAFGGQRYGIPPRGAMDRTAARIVNLAVGNEESAAVLEFYFPGPEIVFEGDHTIALGGADLGAELNGVPVANWRSITVGGSNSLRFRRRGLGNIGYLALRGGLRPAPDDDPNPFRTERIRSAQTLIADHKAGPTLPAANVRISRGVLPAYSRFPTIRVIAGAEFPLLTAESKAAIETSEYVVSNDSNRMGFRLRGPGLSLADPAEMVSSAVSFGTIQLLPDGQLIVLMADHQTSGGYPRAGHIISADLPVLAQLGPGDKTTFSIVDIAAAERAADEIEKGLRMLKAGLVSGRTR